MGKCGVHESEEFNAICYAKTELGKSNTLAGKKHELRGLPLPHPDVKAAMDGGKDIDAFAHTPIPEEARQEFIRILMGYRYELESESDGCVEYIHTNKEWGIQVRIFKTQIAFSVPFWEQAEDAIMDASMAASEIAHDVNLKVFHPDDGTWDE